MGRMFVQFVALCYYEYLSEQLRQFKKTLAEEISSEVDGAQVLKVKKKLLSWLKNTPVYLTLQWFDAVEEVSRFVLGAALHDIEIPGRAILVGIKRLLRQEHTIALRGRDGHSLRFWLQPFFCCFIESFFFC